MRMENEIGVYKQGSPSFSTCKYIGGNSKYWQLKNLKCKLCETLTSLTMVINLDGYLFHFWLFSLHWVMPSTRWRSSIHDFKPQGSFAFTIHRNMYSLVFASKLNNVLYETCPQQNDFLKQFLVLLSINLNIFCLMLYVRYCLIIILSFSTICHRLCVCSRADNWRTSLHSYAYSLETSHTGLSGEGSKRACWKYIRWWDHKREDSILFHVLIWPHNSCEGVST